MNEKEGKKYNLINSIYMCVLYNNFIFIIHNSMQNDFSLGL